MFCKEADTFKGGWRNQKRILKEVRPKMALRRKDLAHRGGLAAKQLSTCRKYFPWNRLAPVVKGLLKIK